MPVNSKAIGKTYDPVLYAVGREKIKEYARAVGETNPVHLDVEAARAAGYADVVAPPMFAVVYSAPSVGPPIFDPAIELNFAMMVHGGQEFVWGPPVVAGDEITTTTSVVIRIGSPAPGSTDKSGPIMMPASAASIAESANTSV